MPSRQEVLLDAAIDVLGDQGVRALTHRAVDAAAGLPASSTANYFPTRESLLGAVVDRFLERERADWEPIAEFVRPSTPAEMADALTTYVHRALGPQRTLTRARLGLFVEAALRPDLQSRLAESALEVRRWGTRWLQVIGSADPDRDCAALLDYLDGVILHQLAFARPIEDVDAAVRRTVETLCRP